MSALAGHEAREHRFLEWYDWIPYRGKRSICPRVLVGKRCQRNDGRFLGCVCSRANSIMDHCALWKDKEGNLVFTTEPYHLNTDDFFKFVLEMADLGLDTEVLPSSGWYPNHTILIAVTIHAEPKDRVAQSQQASSL